MFINLRWNTAKDRLSCFAVSPHPSCHRLNTSTSHLPLQGKAKLNRLPCFLIEICFNQNLKDDFNGNRSETVKPKPSPWGRGTAAAVDEVIQTQRISHKQTIQQNFTDNDRTSPQKKRRGDSRIARQTNNLIKTNGRPMVAPTIIEISYIVARLNLGPSGTPVPTI